jgi:hypothetical protein
VRPANKSEEKQSQGTLREHEIGSKVLADARGGIASFPSRSAPKFSGGAPKFSYGPGLVTRGSNANLSPCFRPAGNLLCEGKKRRLAPSCRQGDDGPCP